MASQRVRQRAAVCARPLWRALALGVTAGSRVARACANPTGVTRLASELGLADVVAEDGIAFS